jgi:hypothetical protein
METRQAQIGKMEKQLQQWGAKLDDLNEKITAAGDKAKADERQLVLELRAKQQRAQQKLDELKAASGDKWDTFKSGLESAYNELESTFKKLGN